MFVILQSARFLPESLIIQPGSVDCSWPLQKSYVNKRLRLQIYDRKASDSYATNIDIRQQTSSSGILLSFLDLFENLLSSLAVVWPYTTINNFFRGKAFRACQLIFDKLIFHLLFRWSNIIFCI